jgi:hypothetical protein
MNKITLMPGRRKEAQWFRRLKLFFYSLNLRRSYTVVGQDLVFWPQAKAVLPQVITVGESVMIGDFLFLAGGKFTMIGSLVHCGFHSSISGVGELVMEDFSGLSNA